MASRLSWLSTCKASQLKAIAVATGINSSGTKPILTSRLLTDLQEEKFRLGEQKGKGKNGQHRIISIDMGIRNLAYCRIALPANWSAGLEPTVPVVEAWERIAISSRVRPDNLQPDNSTTKVKETFDPLTYSCHAYQLITNLLNSGPHPTQILIERQRFRSMGGSAVQEWTLRVNMFEAMLYAVLKTMSEQGLWKGQIWPMAPNKVSKFWLGKEEGIDEGKTKKNKGQKIDIVKVWLSEGNRFELQGKAKAMGTAYLTALDGRRVPRRRVLVSDSDIGGTAETGIGKLDDLADCLLQGMAWIKWEENRRSLTGTGMGALDTLA